MICLLLMTKSITLKPSRKKVRKSTNIAIFKFSKYWNLLSQEC